MILLDSPIYILSTGALLALALLGLYKVFVAMKHRTFLDHKDLRVLKVDLGEIGMSIDSFVKSIKPPFVFEVAVQHLGKETTYYLIVSKSRVKNFASTRGLNEVGDYHLYHSGGEHLGAYFKDGRLWPQISLEKINFSKVNEVGEGAVTQFVFGKRRGEKTVVNLRIVASAPSMFQAREIMNDLKGSFGEYNSVDSSGEEFVHMVNSREFEPGEEMLWGVVA